MIKSILKCVLTLIFVSLFTSCHGEVSSDYLMRHPDVLKHEIERCHADEAKTREIADHCEVVMSAAEKFIKLLNEQQSDPEKFGMRIIDTQAACAKAGSAKNATDCHEVKILLAVVGVNSPE